MTRIDIRQATLEDLPILYEFEQGVIEAERPMDDTLKPGRINYYDLKELVLSDSAHVVVAEIDGEVVGSAYAKIIKSMPYLIHDHQGYLGFMFVRPEHRRKGVNKSIIDELIRWSKSKGLTELRLDVYDVNDAAIKAYEKAGFSKYLINMRMGI